MFYNIIVGDELQTTCSSLKKAQHIVDIYKQYNTFPNKEIQIMDETIKRAENDLLSDFLNSNFSIA